MTEHAVVIAGGGPAGMMLAAELALAKVDVAVVERRPDHVIAGSRAGGLHARTIEVLDQRGVADRFLEPGKTVQAATFGTTVLDLSDFPTRHPYTLALWQSEIERILAGWVAELPVTVHYWREVTGFTQDDSGVDVRAGGRRDAAGAVPGRVRRRPQPDPQARRNRLPRLGRDAQQPDRRGRDGGPAGARTSPRRRRGPGHRPAGARLPRRPDRARARRGRGHAGRAEGRARAGLRHRLRGPQPGLDLPLHRRDAPGRGLPLRARAARRRRGPHPLSRRRTGAQPRGAGRGEPGLETRAGGQRHVAGEPCSTRTSPNAIR